MLIKKPGGTPSVKVDISFPQSSNMQYKSKEHCKIHDHIYNLVKILVRVGIADGEVRVPAMWDPNLNNGRGGEFGGEEYLLFKTNEHVNVNTMQQYINKAIERYEDRRPKT